MRRAAGLSRCSEWHLASAEPPGSRSAVGSSRSISLVSAGGQCFLVNLPVCAVIALAAKHLMPTEDRRADVRLDIRGAILLFLSLNALIDPVMAGRDLGWPTWLWGVMAAGAMMLPWFLRLQQSVARRGGMPADRAGLAGRPGVPARAGDGLHLPVRQISPSTFSLRCSCRVNSASHRFREVWL